MTMYSKPALDMAVERAVAAERERIANRLEEESDLAPCKEDGSVYRSAAWLVRGDFSYDEAERLAVAAEAGAVQQRAREPGPADLVEGGNGGWPNIPVKS